MIMEIKYEGGNIRIADNVALNGHRCFVIGIDPECDGKPNYGLVYPFVNVDNNNNGSIIRAILYSPVGRWTDDNLHGEIQAPEIQMNNLQEQPHNVNG